MFNFLRAFGYFLIWGDFYLVLFFIHSIFVSPITVENYFLEYWQLALYLFEWFGGLNYLLSNYIYWLLTLPAALLFFLRFFFTTLIGLLIIRKINSISAYK